MINEDAVNLQEIILIKERVMKVVGQQWLSIGVSIGVGLSKVSM